MALVDLALALAADGWPVFPCGANKRPAISKADGGAGFHDAVTEPDSVLALFARAPHAELIGVPTGNASGVDALDFDFRNGARAWHDENLHRLPETRIHETQSGGRHMLFRHVHGVRNLASKFAAGMDVRGQGGYIIAPPSPGYRLIHDADIAEWPDWLLELILKPEPSEPRPTYHAPTEFSSFRIERLTDSILAKVRQAPDGQKHYQLRNAALLLGGLQHVGGLSDDEATRALLAALPASVQDWKAAEVTARWGLEHGKSRPWQPEDRPQTTHNTPAPPDMPAEYWEALGLSPELHYEPEPDGFAGEPETVEEGIKSGRLLPFFTFQEAEARLDADDFVEGLLSVRSMAVIYGESNSGKTFFATDLALHVAASRPWRGRAIDGGLVVYLALEGSLGIRNRISAWKDYSGLGDYDLPFIVVPVSVNLLDPDADAGAVIATVKAVAERYGADPKMIVVDTLSRAMAGGNENAPEDMTALIGTGDRIRQQTGACVVWIHHSGKDSAKGARGHSSLRAATDTEIEITAEGQHRLARATKQRELPTDGQFPFALKVVELGMNRRGKPVTTCIVEPSDEAPMVAGARLSGHVGRAIQVLADLIARTGEAGFNGAPPGARSVPEDWWREEFYQKAMPGAEQEAKRKAFRRSADQLISAKQVGMNNGRVWLARHDDE